MYSVFFLFRYRIYHEGQSSVSVGSNFEVLSAITGVSFCSSTTTSSYQSYTTGDTQSNYYYLIRGVSWMAQSFTTVESYDISGVKIGDNVWIGGRCLYG